MDLYSIVPVSDRAKAVASFAAFFGRPAARVGQAMITLGVTGLDDILARLAAHSIDHEPVETYSNGVRHVVVLDPDGNSLSLAEAPGQ